MKRAFRFPALLLGILILIQTVFPAALPASAAGNTTVMVTGTDVNVRAGAGTGNRIIGTANGGDEFVYLGENADTSGKLWYKIQYSSSETGWIISTYSVKLIGEASGVQSYVTAMGKSFGADGVQVAVIKNGALAETYNYGWAVKNTSEMKSDTLIRAASLSKVAVAMNAMKLEEEGKVCLTDDISAYWGDVIARPVTLKSLLSHTSTLKELGYVGTRLGTLKQLQTSGNYNLTADKIGTSAAWTYNNYAVGVAGSTLETALGSTLDGYAREKFFSPLGIEASWMAGELDPSKLASLYYAGGDVARSAADAAKIKCGGVGCNTTSFAGGLTISAAGYAKLIAILANDGVYGGTRYLSAQSVEKMENKLFAKSEGYGTFYQCMPLRFREGLYGESSLYYHTGNAYGTLALASYNPATRNGVVVVTTGAAEGRDNAGIYAVCGKITEYIYKSMKKTQETSSETATTSTTAAETSATDAQTTTQTSTQTTVFTPETTVPTTRPTTVSATDPAQDIEISKHELSLMKGESASLDAVLSPSDSDSTVIWLTSDPRCVTVTQDGEITAAGHGTAVITAIAEDKSDTCTVTVEPKIDIKMLGASIRVKDCYDNISYGIRFGVSLSKDKQFSETAVKEYGTLIIAAGTLGENELTLDTEKVRRIPAVNLLSEDDSGIVFTGVLTDIPEGFFKTNVIGRGYLIYYDAAGGEHVVYTDTITRSFSEVAKLAYDKYASIASPSQSDLDTIELLREFVG